MTNQELKEVMLSGESIVYNEIEYAHVSAIIYRKHEDKLIIQAELADKKANSVTIANPRKVEVISKYV